MNIAQNDGIPLQHGLTDWLTGQHARERKLTKQQGAMMREKPETTKQLNTRHKKTLHSQQQDPYQSMSDKKLLLI